MEGWQLAPELLQSLAAVVWGRNASQSEQRSGIPVPLPYCYLFAPSWDLCRPTWMNFQYPGFDRWGWYALAFVFAKEKWLFRLWHLT